MMGKAFGNIKALILESCVISQVFVTLCNLYNFQALRYSYIFYQHNGCAVTVRIQEGELAAFPKLSYIAGLMAGQEDSLYRAAGEDCEVWYEWMVLLYTRHTTSQVLDLNRAGIK